MPTEGQANRTFTAVVAAAAIGINLAVGTLVQAVKLPLYLDQLGTVFVGFTLGPLPAVGVGVATMLSLGLVVNPTSAYYVATAAAVGLLAGWAGRRGWFRSLPLTIVAGVITAIVAAVVSAPPTVLAFGGVTGVGADLLVGFFRATGRSVWESVLLTGGVSELVDKPATFLLAAAAVRLMPQRAAAAFPPVRNGQHDSGTPKDL